MTDHEDKAAKERMAQRRNLNVTPTDELKKLAEVLGEKPKPTNDNQISEFEMI